MANREDAVNEWRPGRKLFTCARCGKKIWLVPHIFEKYQEWGGICIECKQGGSKHDEQG